MIRDLRLFRRRRDSIDPAELSNNPRQDARIRNEDDNLAVARCPICGYRLVVRQDCGGPYFFCLCVKPQKRAA